MLKFDTPLRAFFLLSVILIILQLLCLGRYPSMGGDEILRSTTAYTLMTRGNFSTNYLHNVPGCGQNNFYPPVVTLLMYLSYLLFGFGVWQTGIVTLAAGAISSFVFFLLAKKILQDVKLSLLALSIFALNILTFRSWQSGRTEAPFILFLLLCVYLLYPSQERLVLDNPKYGNKEPQLEPKNNILGNIYHLRISPIDISLLLVGFFAALAFLTYYPFTVPLIFLLLYLLRYAWQGKYASTFLRKSQMILCVFLGAIPALVPQFLYIATNPKLFSIQILRRSKDYFTSPNFGQQFLLTIASGLETYVDYAKTYFGLLDIILGVIILTVSPFLITSKRERIPWIGLLIWIVFLAFVNKNMMYLYLTVSVPFFALGAVVLWKKLLSRSSKSFTVYFFRILLFAVIGINLLRLAVVGFTLFYQWRGRDYNTFIARVKSSLPNDAQIIGPGITWYALAERTSSLVLYSQGNQIPELETNERAWFNNVDNLKTITHVIIHKNFEINKRCNILNNYLHTNFVLEKTISLPFKPLFWAKNCPFDVAIYVRSDLVAQK